MRYRLVVTDLDGTLLNENGQASPRVRACLAELDRRGVIVVPSTARPPRALRALYESLGLRGPVICYNGAMAFQPGRPTPFFHHGLPRDVALAVLEAVWAASPGLHVGLELQDHWHVSSWTERLQRLVDEHRIEPPRVSDLQAVTLGTEREISKLYLTVAPEVRAAVTAELARRGVLEQISVTSSGSGFVEFMAAGVNKGAALRALAAILGIPRKQTVALGDEENDIPALQAAGLGLAMGNATDAVKAAAGAIVGTNTADGWADAVERFVLAG